jgi:hypothetical protein
MKNLIYWILVLFPFAIIGAYVGNEPTLGNEDFFEYISWIIVLYLPLLSFLRLRYLKRTLKQTLLSFVPFYGIKYRFGMSEKKERDN